MFPAKTFRINDPKNPTMSEKMVILQHVLHQNLKAQDFKFVAFVAAACSEDYIYLLNPAPLGFTSQDGRVDIEKLRELISVVPKLNELYHLLSEKQFSQINPEVINLLYWVILVVPNIYPISAEKFISQLPVAEEISCDRRPAHVFEITTRQEHWFNSIVERHNVVIETGYCYTKIEEIFKLLVHEYNITNSDYLLLRKDLNPTSSLGEPIWENSEFFKNFQCFAKYCILPHNNKIEKFTSDDGYNFIKVYDNNVFILKYLILYENEFATVENKILETIEHQKIENKKIENPKCRWWRTNIRNILLTVSTLMGVVITVKAMHSRLNGRT